MINSHSQNYSGWNIYSRTKAKFTVTLEGGYYHVYKDDGSLSYSNSSFKTALIDEAVAGLTSGRTQPETILTKGIMSVDALLTIPDNVALEIEGSWTKSFNGTMLQNSNRTGYNQGISIIGKGVGAVIDGNSGTYNGKGIDIVCASGTTNTNTNALILLKDLSIQNMYDTALGANFEGLAGANFLKMYNVSCNSVLGHGFLGCYLFNSEIYGVSFSSYDVTGNYNGFRIEAAIAS